MVLGTCQASPSAALQSGLGAEGWAQSGGDFPGGAWCPLFSPASSPTTSRASRGSAPSVRASRAPSPSGRPATAPRPRMTSRGTPSGRLAPPSSPRSPCTARCGAEPSPRATSTWSPPAPGAAGTFCGPKRSRRVCPKKRGPRLPARPPPTGSSTGCAGRRSTPRRAQDPARPRCRPAASPKSCGSAPAASPPSPPAAPAGPRSQRPRFAGW